MKKYFFFIAISLIGIFFFFFDGNSNNNEEKTFKNAVTPSPVQVAGFALGEDVPFLAVNLIKFKEKAEYADERETDLTGREAYAIYADEVLGHLAKVGAEPIFGGDVSSDGSGSSQESIHVNLVGDVSVKVILEMLEHIHIVNNGIVSSNSWERE